MRPPLLCLLAALAAPGLCHAQNGCYGGSHDRDRDLSFRARQSYQLDLEVEVRPRVRRVDPRQYAMPEPRREYYAEPEPYLDEACFRGDCRRPRGGVYHAQPAYYAPEPRYYYRQERERGILPWRTRTYSEGYGNGSAAPQRYAVPRYCGPGGCP